jgi:ActR/RegA family two-component response regulator
MAAILVIEDEYFVADDCAHELRSRGIAVVGPAYRAEEAMRLARTAQFDGAIVDINLNGEKIFSVIDVLRSRSMLIVFYTGYSIDAVPDRFAWIPVFGKPSQLREAINSLLLLVVGCGRP